jgi:GntR family transcriptional regulator
MAERRRGSGTFVTATAGSVDLFTLSGTVSSFRSGGHDLQTELLERAELAAVSDADTQNPFAGITAIRFRRLGKLDDAPVLVEDLWLDPITFPDLETLPLHNTPLSQVVRQHYHLEPTDGEQSFHVEIPTPAIAQALQLAEDTPLLSIQRTLNFPNAKAAVFSRLHCRTDRITFSQKLGGFQT